MLGKQLSRWLQVLVSLMSGPPEVVVVEVVIVDTLRLWSSLSQLLCLSTHLVHPWEEGVAARVRVLLQHEGRPWMWMILTHSARRRHLHLPGHLHLHQHPHPMQVHRQPTTMMTWTIRSQTQALSDCLLCLCAQYGEDIEIVKHRTCLGDAAWFRVGGASSLHKQRYISQPLINFAPI